MAKNPSFEKIIATFHLNINCLKTLTRNESYKLFKLKNQGETKR